MPAATEPKSGFFESLRNFGIFPGDPEPEGCPQGSHGVQKYGKSTDKRNSQHADYDKDSESALPSITQFTGISEYFSSSVLLLKRVASLNSKFDPQERLAAYRLRADVRASVSS